MGDMPQDKGESNTQDAILCVKEIKAQLKTF